MLKRVLILGFILATALLFGLWKWGSAPVCTATAPSQAVAPGYTVLKYCNTLFSNSVVDLNNTLRPGFLLYPTSFGVTLPASDITNDGTGLTITTGPDFSYASLSSAIINNATNKWSGNVVSGGFYIEVDMQFDPFTCQAASYSVSWPAFFLYHPAGLFFTGYPAPGFAYTELDVMEWFNPGIGCVGVRGAAHNWPGDGTDYNCSNSNRQSSFVPDANWHTYGLLLIPSTKNSGTGVIQWYYDNVLQIFVTYSSGGTPNPSTACSNGAFMTADTQPFAWLLNAATGISVRYRNLHIWQHP